MTENKNTWEEFYHESGEYGLMQYPFGVVIEFISMYLSQHRNEIGGGNLKI